MVLPRRYHRRSKSPFVDKRRGNCGARLRGFRASSRTAWRREGDVSLAIDLVEATHQQRYGEGV